MLAVGDGDGDGETVASGVGEAEVAAFVFAAWLAFIGALSAHHRDVNATDAKMAISAIMAATAIRARGETRSAGSFSKGTLTRLKSGCPVSGDVVLGDKAGCGNGTPVVVTASGSVFV